MDPETSAKYDLMLFQKLTEMESADPLYKPTNFWTPGVRRILGDFFTLGLSKFKAWPSAHSWFYPVYGQRLAPAAKQQICDVAMELNPRATPASMNNLLEGLADARRDYDVVRVAWDQERWPLVFDFGEERTGAMPQTFGLHGPKRPVLGRPSLNYMLCLSALSRHVDAVPQSIVEIGGGFAVLGELFLKANPGASYCNFDIPPLSVVSQYYLDHVVPDADYAVHSPWDLPDWDGTADVFVNSYSFQEMEPNVVSNYIRLVAERNVKYVVSLNSFAGKKLAKEDEGNSGGVLEQVTSQSIADGFASHGYQIAGRYRDPHIRGGGELIVLKR